MKSHTELKAERYLANQNERFAGRNADTEARRRANPALFEARRAELGWIKPIAAALSAPDHCADCGKYTKGYPCNCTADEFEPHQLPGYKKHLAIEAIVDEIVDIRERMQRARSNGMTLRNAIKSDLNSTFADVGLRLVNIPNWNPHTWTVLNPRLK